MMIMENDITQVMLLFDFTDAEMWKGKKAGKQNRVRNLNPQYSKTQCR